MSTPRTSGSRSRYTGVTWDRGRKQWKVQITQFGRKVLVGYYPEEGIAAMAWNRISVELFGTRAELNDYEQGRA